MIRYDDTAAGSHNERGTRRDDDTRGDDGAAGDEERKEFSRPEHFNNHHQISQSELV